MRTKADKQWLNDAASLGCVVCRNLGYGESPAEIHHLRTGCGLGQRSGHKKSIPLCHPHHRTGGHGVAFHAGSKVWQKKFGTELELHAQTVIDVDEFRLNIVGRAS